MLAQLSGNWFDLLISVLLILFIWEGYERGFFPLVMDCLNLIVVYILTLFFYRYLSQIFIAQFAFPWAIAQVVAFTSIAIVLQQIGTTIISGLLSKIPKKYDRALYSHLFSFIPLGIQYVVLIVYLLTVLTVLPLPQFLKNGVLRSRIVSYHAPFIFMLEKSMLTLLAMPASDTFAFLSAPNDISQNIALNTSQESIRSDEISAEEIKRTIHQLRNIHNLPRYIEDGALDQIAALHAAEMFHLGYIGERSTQGKSLGDRLLEANIPVSVYAENIALSPLVSIASRGLLETSYARDKILSREYSRMGVSVVDSMVYGYIVVEIFVN